MRRSLKRGTTVVHSTTTFNQYIQPVHSTIKNPILLLTRQSGYKQEDCVVEHVKHRAGSYHTCISCSLSWRRGRIEVTADKK